MSWLLMLEQNDAMSLMNFELPWELP